MRSNRPRLTCAALLLAAMLSGCWDRVQLEDMAYVIAMGVDLADNGRLIVSLRLAEMQQMSMGVLGHPVTEPDQATQVLSAESDTITNAIYILNGAMTRRLDLRHLRTVIVGEPLARQGLEPVVMEMFRSPWSRGTTRLVQVRGGRALDNMKDFQPVAELNPARAQEGLILQAKYLHLTPPVRMHHFVARLAAPGNDPILPAAAVNPWIQPGFQEPRHRLDTSAMPGELPRGGGNPVEVIGTAVFQRDKLTGFLNVDETQMLLALRGQMGKAYITLPDPAAPERWVSLRLHQENVPRYEAWFKSGRPRVAVRLLFEAELLAVPSGVDFTERALREQLDTAVTDYTKQTLWQVLEKLRVWEADPVGFGNLFRGDFSTWKDWAAYDWPKHVPDLQVEVQAEVRTRRFGLHSGPDRTGTR